MEGSLVNPEIDRVGRRILKPLQQDGSMANAELSKAVNVSAATCHRRTQRLCEEGIVHAVRAEAAPQMVNRGALVVVDVVLDGSTPESFGAFEEAITQLPFVLNCHLVAVDFDYFLEIRVRDIADFKRLHDEQLIAFPGVRPTRTFFVMKEVTHNAPLEF